MSYYRTKLKYAALCIYMAVFPLCIYIYIYVFISVFTWICELIHHTLYCKDSDVFNHCNWLLILRSLKFHQLYVRMIASVSWLLKTLNNIRSAISILQRSFGKAFIMNASFSVSDRAQRGATKRVWVILEKPPDVVIVPFTSSEKVLAPVRAYFCMHTAHLS